MEAEGKIISFQEAQQLLGQSEKIKETATPFVIEGINKNIEKFTEIEKGSATEDLISDIHTKAFTHYKDPNNIYIFSLDNLQQLLKDKEATHIMIIKGSQVKKIDSFEKGQPTVIMIPCKDSGEENAQGKMFNTLGVDALEHPQVRYEPISLFEEKHINGFVEILKSKEAVENFKNKNFNTLLVKRV